LYRTCTYQAGSFPGSTSTLPKLYWYRVAHRSSRSYLFGCASTRLRLESCVFRSHILRNKKRIGISAKTAITKTFDHQKPEPSVNIICSTSTVSHTTFSLVPSSIDRSPSKYQDDQTVNSTPRLSDLATDHDFLLDS
jgi:hypothetical protein